MKHEWSAESAFLEIEKHGAILDHAEKTGALVIRVPASLSLRSAGAFDYLVRHYGLSFKGGDYVSKHGRVYGTLSNAALVARLASVSKKGGRHEL